MLMHSLVSRLFVLSQANGVPGYSHLTLSKMETQRFVLLKPRLRPVQSTLYSFKASWLQRSYKQMLISTHNSSISNKFSKSCESGNNISGISRSALMFVCVCVGVCLRIQQCNNQCGETLGLFWASLQGLSRLICNQSCHRN